MVPENIGITFTGFNHHSSFLLANAAPSSVTDKVASNDTLGKPELSESLSVVS